MDSRANHQYHSDLQYALFDAHALDGQVTSWHEEVMTLLNIARGPAWPDRFGRSIRSWLDSKGHEPVRTLSLFSGGGGLDIGFHDAGFQIVQMVELERKYVNTLATNSSSGKLLAGSEPLCVDIREYEPDYTLDVDFIIGGPPCQTFSAAGRRAAGVSGTTDSRGTLFEEYVRILKRLQPGGFLFENVYGIMGAQSGEAWKQIQSAFEDAGYRTQYRILDAADYGVPQHRERLFIVGVKDGDFHFPAPTHGPDSNGDQPFYTAGEAVLGADARNVAPGIGGRYGSLLKDIPPGLNYSYYTKEMGHPSPVFSWRSKFSDFLYKADPDVPSRTLKAQGGQYTGPFSWENRKFSIAELKRLQTIPDDYRIVGGQQAAIEQIGNSVPPQMSRMLALSILNQVMNVKLPSLMTYMDHDKKLGFRKRKRLLTKEYREKASISISNSRNPNAGVQNNEKPVQEEMYKRYISPNFHWQETVSPDSSEIDLYLRLDESTLAISVGLPADLLREASYVVTIVSRFGEEWCFGRRKVQLMSGDFDPMTFTALWKAFEEKTREFHGIADLVQLSGYYQYRPKMEIKLELLRTGEANHDWHFLKGIVEGSGVARQTSARDLAVIWGIEEEDVVVHLRTLRAMGYEVRSHNTNPQITDGEFLIPYSFPTLTPKSVQLRKMLEVSTDG